MKLQFLLTIYCGYLSKLSFQVAAEPMGKDMTLLIHQRGGQSCVHGMSVYYNAIFHNDFTEVPIPQFFGIEGSYCINYCIRTRSCNAIVIAETMEYYYDYQNNNYDYWLEFDWCKAYRINLTSVNITDLNSNNLTPVTNAPVVSTWPEGVIPDESELTLINFNGCCPNRCANGSECKNIGGGSFLCLYVYLEYEDNLIPDAVVGTFQLIDGMVGQALYLDGATTVDINIPGNVGCFREISSCQTMGFSLAFWIKVISDMGFENDTDTVGVISAMKNWGHEGWAVKLIKKNSDDILKLHIADTQIQGQHAWKDIDRNIPFNEWIHYIVGYQYKLLANDDLFNIYKNGKPHNIGIGHYTNGIFHGDRVDKLAFGRRYFDSYSGRYANIELDEVMVTDGLIDVNSAFNFYEQYHT